MFVRAEAELTLPDGHPQRIFTTAQIADPKYDGGVNAELLVAVRDMVALRSRPK
jgi:hypothetical protein